MNGAPKLSGLSAGSLTRMIEQLTGTRFPAFGFKVTGQLTADDVHALSQQIEFFIAEHKKPFGLLADISEMHGATWAARWDEMRFLQHHTNHIARMAVVANDGWQEVSEVILVATAALQAETRYFNAHELTHAWHWVRMSGSDEGMPVRVMYPGKGLFGDYTPEYVGI